MAIPLDTSINVLVLCQRQSGTIAFNKKNISQVHADIDYLRHISGDNPEDIVIIDYLTTGFKHPDDVMTFNFDFNYENMKTIDFVFSHKKYYSYIIIGGCPCSVFNEQNVKLLSYILKDNGKIIISPANNPSYQWWFDQTKFLTHFEKILDKPKIVLTKQKEIIFIDVDGEKVPSFMFKKAYKVKSKDKNISKVFDEIETGGGGSCLFYSLSYATTGKNTLKDARKLRKLICKYKPKDLEPFVAVASSEKSMCDDTSYGTTIEIQKAARLLNKPIIVFKENRKQGIASEHVCPGAQLIDIIKTSKIFKGVSKYLSKQYNIVQNNIYCIFLPENNTDVEPILLYNIGDYHYRLLKPKRKSRKASRKSRKASRKSRKTSRKSRKTSRKSRKTSRKSRKTSRKSRKTSRKSRKTSGKSRKTSRKSRKTSRKSRKTSRKSRKTSGKSRKTSGKSRKTSRKSKK